jgi:hypothetical protein
MVSLFTMKVGLPEHHQVPFYSYYDDWRSQLKVPSDFRATGRRPLYLTLKKHYTSDIRNVVPQDDAANGMQIECMAA